MRKGSKITKGQRISLSNKKRWLDPVFRKKFFKSVRNAHSNPITKKRHRDAALKQWSNTKHRELIKKIFSNPKYKKIKGEISRKMWSNSQFRKRHRIAMTKAQANPKYKKKISKIMRKRSKDPKWRKRHSEAMRKAFASPEARKRRGRAIHNAMNNLEYKKRHNAALREVFKKPVVKKRRSEASKKNWEKPDYKEKHRIALSGENNPSWLGGISFEPYSANWTRALKKSIRERDHYTCQMCGKKTEKQTTCVHHIDYNKKNCKPDNLITLCPSCHVKTNSNRKEWIKYFKTGND